MILCSRHSVSQGSAVGVARNTSAAIGHRAGDREFDHRALVGPSGEQPDLIDVDGLVAAPELAV